MKRFPTFGPTQSSVVHQRFDVVHVPGGIQLSPGDTLYFQCWFRDTAASGFGVDLSDGYRVTFVP